MLVPFLLRRHEGDLVVAENSQESRRPFVRHRDHVRAAAFHRCDRLNQQKIIPSSGPNRPHRRHMLSPPRAKIPNPSRSPQSLTQSCVFQEQAMGETRYGNIGLVGLSSVEIAIVDVADN
jgi:hypothetical protein